MMKIHFINNQNIEKNIANIFGLYHKLVYFCIVILKQKRALVINGH